MNAVTYKTQANEKMVFLSGAMDRKGVSTLLKKYTMPDSNVILNMKEITRIDSTGIGFLMKILKSITTKGYWIRLKDVPEKVQMLLELTQVDRILRNINGSNQLVNPYAA